MKPIKFQSVNRTMIGKNVDPLPVYHGQGMFISRWRATWGERLSILFYGTIWVSVASDRHPPLSITGRQAAEFVHPEAAGGGRDG